MGRKRAADLVDLARDAERKAHELDLEARLRQADRAVRDGNARMAQYAAELDAARARIAAMTGLPSRIVPRPIRPRKHHGNEAVPIIVGSDWHVEQVVRPERVNGLNEFNLDVAERRLDRLWQGAATLIEGNRWGATIRQAVLALIGDQVTGFIHPEYVEDNSLSPVRALDWLEPRITGGIDHLLEQCDIEVLHVVCASGNHDRIGEKKRITTREENSLTWLLWRRLARHYAGNPRVRVYVPEGYHQWLDVVGYPIRFHHGDAIRFGGGVGGVAIPLLKAIAQWNKARPAYLDVIGHWHQLRHFGNAIVNGSLIGYDEFALFIRAEYEPPRQAFFMVRQGRGLTTFEPIFVEKRA